MLTKQLFGGLKNNHMNVNKKIQAHLSIKYCHTNIGQEDLKL